VAELADFLDLTVGHARSQFRELGKRSPVGGSTAHRAPEPVPTLARLFSRSPSSVLAKTANLDGSRSHGGKYDILAGAVLRDEPAHFTHIYRPQLIAARAEGIHADRLPDFPRTRA
jgi:putative restriction endonuclease